MNNVLFPRPSITVRGYMFKVEVVGTPPKNSYKTSTERVFEDTVVLSYLDNVHAHMVELMRSKGLEGIAYKDQYEKNAITIAPNFTRFEYLLKQDMQKS